MPHTMADTAVVLLSGGMDSATALAMTIKEGHDVIGLTFDYGQRHRKEIDAAARIAKHFREVARLGTKRGVEGAVMEIRTPLIHMSKADIVRKGEELGVPWELTWSCYLGGLQACGICDSCQLRLKGFREAGVKDPLPYASRSKRAAKS